MRECFFALIAIALMSTAAFASDGIPDRYYGTYTGVSPILVTRGANYEESQVGFRVEQEGIFWPTNIEGKVFKIFYPNSWLIDVKKSETLRGWFPDSVTSTRWAIRQSQSSEAAQIIIDFSEAKIGNTPFQATAILGEGMPVSLGVFVSEEGLTAEDVANRTRSLFGAIRSEGVEEVSRERYNHLIDLNLEEARRTMETGEASAKVSVIQKAGHNLWTGLDAEIDERIELIELGLRSNSPAVQEEALNVFILGGRVTDGVSLVVAFLENAIQGSRRFQGAVLDKSVDAAVVLLYESHRHLERLAELRSKFGTIDIGLIHEKTGGIISAADADAIQYLTEERSTKRSWTTEHFLELRRVLSLIKENKDSLFSEAAKSDAIRGLTDYTDKAGSSANQCANLLGE